MVPSQGLQIQPDQTQSSKLRYEEGRTPDLSASGSFSFPAVQGQQSNLVYPGGIYKTDFSGHDGGGGFDGLDGSASFHGQEPSTPARVRAGIMLSDAALAHTPQSRIYHQKPTMVLPLTLLIPTRSARASLAGVPRPPSLPRRRRTCHFIPRTRAAHLKASITPAPLHSRASTLLSPAPTAPAASAG